MDRGECSLTPTEGKGNRREGNGKGNRALVAWRQGFGHPTREERVYGLVHSNLSGKIRRLVTNEPR